MLDELRLQLAQYNSFDALAKVGGLHLDPRNAGAINQPRCTSPSCGITAPSVRSFTHFSTQAKELGVGPSRQ